MKRLNILIGSAFLFGITWAASTAADAAELYGGYRRIQPSTIQPHREAAVGWGCPDRYSCYPLYGAYRMPYGTPGYWARYTMSGWAAY
jgi:hypothetical protein